MDASRNHCAEIETLYTKYADMLYRLAVMQMRSCHDAEDAVADVFMKYMTYLPSFKDPSHEKAWFIRVLLNKCNDLHRRNSVRAYTPLEDVVNISAEFKETDVLEQVSLLPEKHRSMILLHYFEGFSMEEIAVILKTTPAAAKMRLMRARNALKPLLKGEQA